MYLRPLKEHTYRFRHEISDKINICTASGKLCDRIWSVLPNVTIQTLSAKQKWGLVERGISVPNNMSE